MQERIQLSEEQLALLIQTRRTLLAHIGALLAEREQIGTRIRVSIVLFSGLAPACMRFQSPTLLLAHIHVLAKREQMAPVSG